MSRRRPVATVCLLLALAPLAGLAAAGCEHWQKAATALDNVAQIVDEYGTATVTEPLLLEDKGQFKMKIDRSVQDYVDAARKNVQGSERSAILEALAVQAGLGFRADITGVANPFANPLAPPSTQPFTVPAAEGSVLPTTLPATSVLPAFTAVPGPTTAPSSLSERQVLTVGVNDKATEVLLKNLFHPQNFGENKRVYIGILQVSCQPGWRTREGYIADISVSVRYATRNPRNEKPADPCKKEQTKGNANPKPGAFRSSDTIASRPQPLVLCAFPSVEAQTLDLQSNLRSRISTALALSALIRFGPAQGQADALTNYARQLERDAATRTPIPIVTSYSNGSQFGYQIRPAFQAISDLPADNGKPGQVLQPASFPAVVLLVCDKNDFDPRYNEGFSWDYIEFYVSTRWVPADPDHSWHALTESRRFAAAAAMDEALAEAKAATQPGPSGDGLNPGQSYRVIELGRRLRLYESAGLGITRFSALPTTCPAEPPQLAEPQIADIYPSEGWTNADTAITVRGEGFADNHHAPVVKQVIVGGVACSNVTVVGDRTLVAVVPAGSFAAPDPKNPVKDQEVLVVTPKGVARSGNVKISFTRERKVDQPVTGVTLVRTPDGKVLQLIVPRDGTVAGDRLMGAIQAILQGEAATISQDKLLDLIKAALGAKAAPPPAPQGKP